MARFVMRSFAFAAAAITALTAAAPTAAAQTTFTISEADVASIAAKVGENPDDYSGFYYDGDHYVLTVPERAPARGQALVRSLSASGKQAKVVVQTRPTTYRDLLTIRDKVGAGSLGQVPVVWGVDPRRDLVRVGVRTLTSEVVQAAQRTYGDRVEVFDASSIQPAKGEVTSDRPIRFEQFTEAEMTAQAAASRILDSAPYYAGDRIIARVDDTHVGYCTSGYHNASRNTILTAGHCYTSGTVVYQGYYDEPTSTVRYTTVFGRVGEVQWGDNRMDAEVIPNVSDLSYAVWAGPAPNPSGPLPFTGRTMAVAGSNVCTDGSVTGEKCQAVVTLVDGCQRVDNFNVCGVDAAQAPSGTRVVEHGDSGGPVIRHDNSGGALFTGIISAGNVGRTPGAGPGDYVIFTDSSRACTIAQC